MYINEKNDGIFFSLWDIHIWDPFDNKKMNEQLKYNLSTHYLLM